MENPDDLVNSSHGNPASPAASIGPASTPWGDRLNILACTHCQARYLAIKITPAKVCPNCLTAALTQVEREPLPEDQYSPELIIPFKVQAQEINQSVAAFARGIPYPPEDLTGTNLSRRFIPIFFPTWLIDASINAIWQAEMGFDYQVVSHQDRYDQNSGRWISHEIKETRIRWEPRSGSLTREYSNVATPALENEPTIRKELGEFPSDSSQEFKPMLLPAQSYVAIPDRPQQDAWNEAALEMKNIAGSECQAAGGADHFRNFKWDPQFSHQNWTLMLRPAYVSYYVDDDSKPQKVLIHGTTGRITGQRKASMKKAQTQALTIFIVAALIFMLGLIIGAVGLAFPPALVFGGLMLLVGVIVGLSALIPIFRAWQFNQGQR